MSDHHHDELGALLAAASRWMDRRKSSLEEGERVWRQRQPTRTGFFQHPVPPRNDDEPGETS